MKDPVFSERLESLLVARIDIAVFFTAFVSGAALFLVLHALRVRQLAVTSAIVAIMLAYALIVMRVPRLRVRLDQAGDNGYYLGLLFTLMSMAVALWEFGKAASTSGTTEYGSGPRQIIANFGIALATTITGILLRVVLHQLRVDPADVESMTRIELAEASTRVKAALDSVTADMGRFHEEVRQRTEDVSITVLDGLTRQLTEFTDTVTAAMQRLLEATGAAQV